MHKNFKIMVRVFKKQPLFSSFELYLKKTKTYNPSTTPTYILVVKYLLLHLQDVIKHKYN